MVPSLSHFRLNLWARIASLGTLLFVEKIVLSGVVDARRAREAQGLGALLHFAQHWGFRCLVTFLAAAAVFAFVKTQRGVRPSDCVRHLPTMSVRWMLAHVSLFLALLPLSYLLFRGQITAVGLAVMACLWLFACSFAVIAAGVALFPVDMWLRGFRSIGFGWGYAAGVALLGTGSWLESERLWNSAAEITFQMVTWALVPFLHLSHVDPATRIIATPHFAVEITDTCSGLEGLGLTLAFSVMWLAYFRREYIFPRALILVPLSLAVITGLNVLRIAALLLIGDAGYPEVASFGFHSQAGWIAFNAVACGLAYFSRRSAWMNRIARGPDETIHTYNPTAPYLVPLLAIIAAGTLSHALSGRFEIFYPLRFIAALAALVAYRRALLAIRWKCTWRGPAAGAGVFLVWIGAARWLLPEAGKPESLAGMLPSLQIMWVFSHCFTSVVFVPVAEELAYRGYLMRRLTNVEFESVPYQSVRWPALAATAIAFGAAHGKLWLAGIIAGIAYGMLPARSGSLGQSVAAHATTNGLIAIAVLAGNQWQLW